MARLLMLCVFLPQRLQVIAAIGTSVYFVFRTLVMGYRPQRRDMLVALLLGSSYFLYLAAAALTDAPFRTAAFRVTERVTSLALLPVVFAIISRPFSAIIAGQLRYFVYGCLIVCIMGNADFLYHHVIVDKGMIPLSHVRYRMIFEPFTGIHPTYMGVYLSFAICIVMVIWHPLHKWERVVMYLTLYTLLLFLLALFAKSPLLALVAIAAHFLYHNRAMLRQYLLPAGIMGAVVAGAFAFIPFVRQRAVEMLGLFGSTGNENITQNSVHTRRLIWDTDVSVLHHYWLTGVGPGRLLQALHQRYFFHSLYRGYAVGYFDPHSQYFSHWLSFGISGIILLVVVLLLHFGRAITMANRLYLYLLIILAVTFFTETFLLRQHGVLFYAIFTSLFFFLQQRDRAGELPR